MKTILLITAACLFSLISYAQETRTYVMPDGTQVTVEIPPGMSYTEEEARAVWELDQRLKEKKAEAARRPGPSIKADRGGHGH